MATGDGKITQERDQLLFCTCVLRLRWLEIVSRRARPGLLSTATESRPMHATIELKMEYVARARASAPGLRMRK